MRVLLTGATGFLGSRILMELIKEGHDVVALKRATSDIKRIETVMGQIKLVTANKPSDLNQIFYEHAIEVVVHCAVSYGKTTETSMSDTVNSNILFPVILMECAIRNGCRYFINSDSFFSQQMVANPLKKPDHLYSSEYTMSKYYFREYGYLAADKGQITFINLVLHHLYGGCDDKHKFIPQIIDLCRSNIESIALTTGVQKRDFIYLEDVVDAYRIILKNLSGFSCGYYNFEIGTETAIEVKEAVNIIKSVLGSTTQLVFGALPEKRNEIMYSCADGSMFKSFGWKAQIDFETGIRKTIREDYGQ